MRKQKTSPVKANRSNPQETTITGVIRWCADNGDSYPMPLGCSPCNWPAKIKNDLPERNWGVDFCEEGFFNLSKTQFAEVRGVSPAQVSRWIKAGLPVRPDDRIDWHAGERWCAFYERDCAERRANGWKKQAE